MSTFEKISPDDPRLTAYALGELEPVERAEFEARLKQDAAARAWVAELNGTAQSIGEALQHEPLPAFVAAPVRSPVVAGSTQKPRERSMAKMLRFPQLYFTISGLAAACFVIGFVFWERNFPSEPKRHYVEVDLTKLRPSTTSAAANMMSVLETKNGGKVGLKPALVSDEGSDNRFIPAASEPQSTFPIKTGTAAYVNVRQLIQAGQHPTRETVRIEELVNYFPYSYSAPESLSVGHDGSAQGDLNTTHELIPFAAHLEVASAPWAPEHRLVRIGLKGREAKKLAVTSAEGALSPIAKGVKILVEFNPAQVQAYRLIGYENRMPSKADDTDNSIDAGEINAGHMVTALYEIVPVGAGKAGDATADTQKYREPSRPVVESQTDLLTLQVRYQAPDSDQSQKLEFPLRDAGQSFDLASADFKFAASVAAFGMILRDSPHKGGANFAHVTEWARDGMGNDAGGFRSEFVGLVGQAERLSHN